MENFPLGKHISYLYRIQQSYLTNETMDYDIGGGQVSFVFTLFRFPGSSQEEVAKHLDLDKTTVARALYKMEENQIIKRIKDNKDQRILRLYLTDKGMLLMDALESITKEWYSMITEGMSSEEKYTLETLMTKMTDNVKQYNQKEKA